MVYIKMGGVDRRNKSNYGNYAKYIAGGLAGAGLGYLGYKGYQGIKTLYGYGKDISDVYQGAKAGMAAKGALETTKMIAQGSRYVPTIPGGFPSTLASPSTPYFTALSGGFPDIF